MRVPGWVTIAGIVAAGAVVLSPAVAALGIDPLPGDITFNWQDHHIFFPFTQSLCLSLVLGLLFLWARK